MLQDIILWCLRLTAIQVYPIKSQENGQKVAGNKINNVNWKKHIHNLNDSGGLKIENFYDIKKILICTMIKKNKVKLEICLIKKQLTNLWIIKS